MGVSFVLSYPSGDLTKTSSEVYPLEGILKKSYQLARDNIPVFLADNVVILLWHKASLLETLCCKPFDPTEGIAPEVGPSEEVEEDSMPRWA